MRSLEVDCSTSVQQQSTSSTGVQQQRAAPACSSSVQHQRAAAVDEQHRRAAIEARRAFRTGGIRNGWRLELGAQQGRENQPACSSLGQSVTIMSPAKTAEPMEMAFGLWTQVGPF